MEPQLAVTIVYEPGDDGWVVASIPEIPGVLSQGRSREEARANVIDALRLTLTPEPVEDSDHREREQLHLTIAADDRSVSRHAENVAFAERFVDEHRDTFDRLAE